MADPALFADLVSQVYDAAFDPALWSAFLDALRRALHGGPTALLLQDTQSAEVGFIRVEGQDPAATVSYLQHFVSVNLLAAATARLPVGTTSLSHRLVERDSFEKSEFYNDWLRPQDIYFGIGHVVERGPGGDTDLTVFRSARAGPFAEAEAGLFRDLSHHVDRAIAIHRRLHSITRERNVALEAIEALALGVLLLDRTGRILFANQAAQGLLNAGDAIAAKGGRLQAIDRDAMARLSALLRSAAAAKATAFGAPGGSMALAARSGRFLSVLVCRYHALGGELDRLAPAVIVFVGEQHRLPGILPGHIARLYRLSPAEARLAGALVAGQTLSQYAEQAGITADTARTCVKSVFAKTGTNRQATLVATLLSDPVLRLAATRRRD